MFAALALCAVGYACRFRAPQDVNAAVHTNAVSYESLAARPDFYHYEHRGRAVMELRRKAGAAGPPTVERPTRKSEATTVAATASTAASVKKE